MAQPAAPRSVCSLGCLVKAASRTTGCFRPASPRHRHRDVRPDHRGRNRARVRLRPGLRPRRLRLPRLAVLQRRRGARRRPQLDRRVHPPRARRGGRPDDPRAGRAGLAPPPSVPRRHRWRCSCWCSPRPRSAARPSRRTSRRRYVAAHLGLAMLLLGRLLYLWRGVGRRAPRERRPAAARRWPIAATRGGPLHGRGGRLHGRHAELRPGRLPARRRRAPRLRQAVPHLQRRLHAVRAGAPGRHPPDPPRLHVPRLGPADRADRGVAAPPRGGALRARRWPRCLWRRSSSAR